MSLTPAPPRNLCRLPPRGVELDHPWPVLSFTKSWKHFPKAPIMTFNIYYSRNLRVRQMFYTDWNTQNMSKKLLPLICAYIEKSGVFLIAFSLSLIFVLRNNFQNNFCLFIVRKNVCFVRKHWFFGWSIEKNSNTFEVWIIIIFLLIRVGLRLMPSKKTLKFLYLKKRNSSLSIDKVLLFFKFCFRRQTFFLR